MKKHLMIGWLILALLIAMVVVGYQVMPSAPPDRPVRLVITGPSGEHFAGSYVANGITNTISAIAPAVIGASAREFCYELKPDDSRQEFRVKLEVANVLRTSFISYQGTAVRGGCRYTADHDSAW